MKKLYKEFGSEFHWIDYSPKYNQNLFQRNYNLYSTGRDAIRDLIIWGKSKGLFKRIWLPSYYCPHVTAAIKSTGIKCEYYSDNPWFEKPNLKGKVLSNNDLFLYVNYFGLRYKLDLELEAEVFIIEDHTHSPFSEWADKSEADWCFASLRKTLPIPDGGILWTKKNNLPPQPGIDPIHEIRFLNKLTGMLLKSKYLAGQNVDKEIFRNFFLHGEKLMDTDLLSSISKYSQKVIYELPVNKWQNIRKENFYVLLSILENQKNIQVLKPDITKDIAPFSAVIIFSSEHLKMKVFKELLKRNIYTAILWDLNGCNTCSKDDLDFSQRMISVHCDMRYSEEDMHYIGNTILELINN